MRILVWILACGMVCPSIGLAQAPPLEQLPQVPAGNPLTAERIALGKALFWDEQLSLTGTTACGTCHRPQAAGTDPRSAVAGAAARHPGPDGIFGTGDDITASPGVPAHDRDGNYLPDPQFGLRPQVGPRKANSVVNAAYAPMLFWDGRADNRFVDPLSGELLLPNFAALETQALQPLLNTAEMGHAGIGLNDVVARIASVRPLALAEELPPALAQWIGERSYPQLFAEAFGSAELTPARLAMALASYQRSLVANQTPLDQHRSGIPSLTPLELQGETVFRSNDCEFCHTGPLFSDFRFHYIGVRPVTDDPGRFTIDGDPSRRGAMQTPGLRGVAERAPYMHNGGLATLQDVIEFYNRGGDFSAPNKAGQVRPRNWTTQQKAALLAFLSRPLSDPRVAAELPPFDRPRLYTESDHVPQILGTGRPGTGGLVPQLSALEPPLRGNDNFTLVLSGALSAAQLQLVVDAQDPGLTETPPGGSFAELQAQVDAHGNASLQLDLHPQRVQPGQVLWARVYVADAAASSGWAVSPAARFTVFGQHDDPIFAGGFESTQPSGRN